MQDKKGWQVMSELVWRGDELNVGRSAYRVEIQSNVYNDLERVQVCIRSGAAHLTFYPSLSEMDFIIDSLTEARNALNRLQADGMQS